MTIESSRRADLQVFTLEQMHAFKNQFELQQGEHILGTLTFSGRMGIKGEFASLDRQQPIPFTYHGLSGKHLTITDTSTDTLLGQFERSWTGSHGKLMLADGRMLGWRNTSRWKSTFVLEDAEGHQIIRFSSKLGRKLGAQAEVDATAAALPELTLLLVLGFFLLIVANETMLVSILATH